MILFKDTLNRPIIHTLKATMHTFVKFAAGLAAPLLLFSPMLIDYFHLMFFEVVSESSLGGLNQWFFAVNPKWGGCFTQVSAEIVQKIFLFYPIIISIICLILLRNGTINRIAKNPIRCNPFHMPNLPFPPHNSPTSIPSMDSTPPRHTFNNKPQFPYAPSPIIIRRNSLLPLRSKPIRHPLSPSHIHSTLHSRTSKCQHPLLHETPRNNLAIITARLATNLRRNRIHRRVTSNLLHS